MKKTLYMNIADKIAAYIMENKLQPGDKLPTYREFADLFGVSVHTVGSALERLQYKGMVDIRPQSGIFVMEDAWNTLYPNTFDWHAYFSKTKKVPIDVLRRFRDSRKRYDPSSTRYVISNLGLSPEFGGHPLWEKSTRKALANLTPDSLYIPPTDDLLRYNYALAEHMKYYGLDLPPDNILLTKGTNFSLLFIALTFFSPGTICYYLSPSMLDVSVFCDITGFIKTPIPTDSEGIDLEYFSERIRKGVKSFLIVSPEIALSGTTMSVKRRRDLYHLCHTNGIPIVELDEYRDYRSESLPPIKALDRHGIVFYVGTFHNTLNNSAEAGWVAATPELIERLTYVELSMWTGCEMLPHQTVYEMLTSGEYRNYVTKLQKVMRERERRLNSLLDKYLGDIAKWNRNSEVFFWVRFKDHIDVKKITANKEGLTLGDYSQYAFSENNSIMISLTGIRQADLEGAIKQLSYLARKSIKL